MLRINVSYPLTRSQAWPLKGHGILTFYCSSRRQLSAIPHYSAPVAAPSSAKPAGARLPAGTAGATAMGFISYFWAAYVPVGIVAVAAVVELVTDARKRRTRRPSPDKFENAAANVIALSPKRPRSSLHPHPAAVPARGAPGLVVMLSEARNGRVFRSGVGRTG
jgi:hypothetical protein